ncbi:NosD domain-containing protein [Jannaschia sp. 2305UL9-9]|uniref:NosD domain-containing protein n=1 Tax=Jannaschia sp. 2305UL9-9 TaxID=3121638 RepID=UPI003526D57F
MSGPAGATQPLSSGAALSEAEARYAALVSDLAAPPEARDHAAETRFESRDPDLQITDLRIALMKLGRPEDAAAQATVLRAQPDGRRLGITLMSGDITFADLLAALPRMSDTALASGGLSVPLIIEQGASLLVGPGDALRLDRGTGAFIVNFGTLHVVGGSIAATGHANNPAPDFAPFIATAGQGVMMIEDAHVTGLGFGHAPTYAGLSVMVSGLYRPKAPSRVTGTTFRDTGSLSLSGGADALIADNVFDKGRSSDLILRGTDRARVLRNTFVDGQAGDAIRLSDHATATRIAGNAIYRPRNSGISIADGSHGTDLRDTVIWRPRHHGVLARESDCLSLTGMRILAPRHEGILLRGTRQASIVDTDMIGSGHAGLMIADQPEFARTRIAGNRFAMNRTGIETAAPGHLDLTGNDFSDQFPRFLAGDIQLLTPVVMRDLRGEAPFVLAAGGIDRTLPPPATCTQYEDS